MTEEQLQLQLARIEELQARLRQVISDESLDGLDQLAAELGSRLNTLLAEAAAFGPAEAALQERLRAIATAQRELTELARATHQSLGKRLGQARTMRRASSKYTTEPARQQAPLASRTDWRC